MPFALCCLISGYGLSVGVLLGYDFVCTSPPSERGLVPVVCAFVCLVLGRGVVVGLRMVSHVVVCQPMLVGLGRISLLWCVR